MKNSKSRWVLGHKVTSHLTSGDYDLAICETPPKVQGPPPHSHNYYEESFLVIQGEMEFFVNGNIKVVKEGESIDIPHNTVHTFNNIKDETCRWINIHSPKGFLRFFETMGIPANEEGAQAKSLAPELINQVIRKASDFDMQIKI